VTRIQLEKEFLQFRKKRRKKFNNSREGRDLGEASGVDGATLR